MNIDKELVLYCVNVEEKDFELTTIWNYKAAIKAFLRYFEEKESSSEITLEEVYKYLELWENPNTRYSKLNAIKSFYRISEINTINFESFDRPKRVKEIPKKIDRKFLLECINEIDNRKHKAFIALAYSTGMLISEIIALKIKDIDFNNNKILVRKKELEKNRTVVLSKEMAKILTHYMKKYNPIDFLFNGKNSIQYSNRTAQSVIKKWIGEEYTFQMIRNAHIYSLVESDADTETINNHLGFEQKSGKRRLQDYKKNSIKNVYTIKPPM